MQINQISLTLFCKVIDNYGDIGICWRLAKQLVREHQLDLTLWVDDLVSFKRLCPDVTIDVETQTIEHVTIRHWRNQDRQFVADDVSDIVIEFFGCDLPPNYLAAMAARKPHPVWLNLEGLSAEKWVEGCHQLPSPHPSLPITKYFFFPGFTKRTGGLLLESGQRELCHQFQQDQAKVSGFLSQLGVTPDEMAALKVSMFCYPHAPIAEVFDSWRHGLDKVICLVPEGVAQAAVENFLEQPAHVGTHVSKGALTVRVIPFLSQPDYDQLLWACDLNFVRGEDSFVRAQWANRPFIWHIYPQDKDLHHVKLKAFLQCFTASTASWAEFSLAWNDATHKESVDFNSLWRLFKTDLSSITGRVADWQQQLDGNDDLASNLMRFSKEIAQK